MRRTALLASGLFLFAGTTWADQPKGKDDGKKTTSSDSKTTSDSKTSTESKAPPAAAPPAARAAADIKGEGGKSIGTAALEETPHGVLITVNLTGAPSGMHAFHIHETGKCEAPFKTAGGHFNPEGHEHGFKNPAGKHAGDLPNIEVGANGKGTFQFFAHGVTLKAGEKNSLLDTDGSALVMHKGVDDYTEAKTGNAGDRIACGVIEKAK